MIALTLLLFAVARRKIQLAWRLRFGFSSECATVEEMRAAFAELHSDEDSARAQLMKLRVYAMEDGEGNTGFAVTAFIPNGVLAQLRAEKNRRRAFTRRVSDELVRRALLGLWNLTGQERKATALVFEPMGQFSRQASTWVEGQQRPAHIAPMTSPAASPATVGEIQGALYASRAHAGLVQSARPARPTP